MKLPVASHTFLSNWHNCPHKAYRLYIAKDLPKQPQTKEMLWGKEVHSAFEVRIKHGTPFPQEMPYEKFAAPLVVAGASAEKMLGINATGESVDFFAKDVWLRGKVDATVLGPLDPVVGYASAVIFDWKTGKRREEADELKIHAVLIRAWKPELVRITAHYVWLQDMEIGKRHSFVGKDIADKFEDVKFTMAQVANAIEIENFPKRQNPLCGWCDVTDCEHNKKGKR